MEQQTEYQTTPVAPAVHAASNLYVDCRLPNAPPEPEATITVGSTAPVIEGDEAESHPDVIDTFWIVVRDQRDMRAGVRHKSEDAARTEAERLARTVGGRFFVFALRGAVEAIRPVRWQEAHEAVAVVADPFVPRGTHGRRLLDPDMPF